MVTLDMLLGRAMERLVDPWRRAGLELAASAALRSPWVRTRAAIETPL